MRKAFIATLFAIVAIAGTVPAHAAVSTNLTIRHNATTDRFHGVVSADNADCVGGRLVKVYKKTSSGRSLQGKVRASSSGAWRLEVMHASGHYFAVAPRVQAMHATCARARSTTIDVM